MDETRRQRLLAERLATVRRHLSTWNVDGILINSALNRRWLSGFTGSNGMLLITTAQALLATDSRYAARIPHEAPHFTLYPHDRTAADTRSFIAQAAVTRIGVEASQLTLAAFDDLQAIAGIQWIPLAETVEPLRAVKSSAETEQIRAAAAITDAVMAQVPQLVRPGLSERTLAWELEKRMRDLGAEAVAFPVIVAGGPHAAHPHHEPGGRPLQAGDALVVDMGARLDGYHSDLTRTFFLGAAPEGRFRAVYDCVAAAQRAVFQAGRAGMTLREVDALARDTIAGAGYDRFFGHGLGHGLGLEIHEAPFLSPRARPDAVLAVGMHITIEPGIYIPEWGGVRIEDLALVTEDGLEPLSHCPQIPLIPFD